MLCKSCDKEIKNDGELVIKSYAGGRIAYVHTGCHYQHLINHCSDEYLEFEEFERILNKEAKYST